MATIPDKLMRDIRKHLGSWQKVNDAAEREADTLVYAIDLTVRYEGAPPDTKECGV